MKKQKTLIIISIFTAMVLLLAACGGQSAKPAEEAQTQAEAVDNGNSAADTEAAVDASESAAVTDEEAADASESVAVADEATAAGEDQAAGPGAKEETEWSFGSFTTMDLDGNEVTESIFADKEYTMVNYWGTFCPPCIAEMPDLQKLSESLPENIQMVGLICDLPYEAPSDKTKDAALEILESANAEYKNILIWEEANQLISSFTAFVPTTFFVDSEGTIVGEPIIGADVKSYEARISELAE